MTVQIREVLILNGKKRAMETFPPLPWRRLENEERVAMPDVLLCEWPDGTKDYASNWLHSTACWRGYQGIWEIRDDRLWFVGLNHSYTLARPMLANWFSGTLKWNEGQFLGGTGYWPVHKREVRMRIERGSVVDTTIITNQSVEEAMRRRDRERVERDDADDARLTNRRCPHCGKPCPRYRKTCKHCHKYVGREP